MITIKTGFEDNQKYSIPDDEAHKAYYLFLHPEQRGIFSTGLALTGKIIQAVEPDYQGTMGWNHTHELDDDDWDDIRKKGVDLRLRNVLYKAKQIASMGNIEILNKPLSELSDTGQSLPLLEKNTEEKMDGYIDEERGVYVIKPNN